MDKDKDRWPGGSSHSASMGTALGRRLAGSGLGRGFG